MRLKCRVNAFIIMPLLSSYSKITRNKHTHTETDTQTDALITILSSPIWGGLITRDTGHQSRPTGMYRVGIYSV